MDIKTFNEKGYRVHEFASAVIEYQADLSHEWIPDDPEHLETIHIEGDVVDEHFQDEASTYAIIDKNQDVLFDDMDFEELKERIQEMK